VQIDEQHAGHPGHLPGLGGEAREEGNELELAHPLAQVVLAGAGRVPAAIARQARHRELLIGDVLHQNGGLFEDAVVLATRIESTPPDEIYASVAAPSYA
jgi:hypothetical protein